jgi:hypothetical protein
MSTADATELTDVLNLVKTWPTTLRIALARKILESLDKIETHPVSPPPRKGSLKDLLGILKTDAPSPNDEECRAILEEELMKKHVK